MLSGPTPLASAEQAFGYFLHEYLARNDPEHRTANRWHGRGAAALGLPQRVGKRRFMAVLAGRVPGTAIRLGRIVDGEHQHRPGWDATFSAPKSVSLEALLYGNKSVLRAHDAAVRATLDWVEAEFLQTRGWEPGSGRRPRVKADGLVAATFRHVASRNNDPQLHTHTVIANMTRNLEGEWRSVEPTLLRRRRRLIGAWYRNELARRLVEMGYVLVPTEIGGLPSFELAGYGPAILEAFSTRRRDILAHMAEKGWDYTAASAQRATLHTRKPKVEPGRPELAAMWKRRAETLGLSRDGEAVRLDRQERRFMQAPPRFSALEAVWQAVDHMEERHSVFASADLLAAALGRDPGRHGHEDLERAIGRLIDDNHLVETKDGALTTRRTIRAEKEIVSAMKKGRGKAEALAVRQEVRNRLDRTTLTEGQKEAVDTILLSQDRIVGVQGFAGTGKTRMLSEVAGLAGARTVFGFAPSAAASRVLAVEGGISTTTLQWLLTRYGRIADGTAGPDEVARAREAFRDAILVVDEASMVGTVQMRDLMRIVERLGAARLVLVGDSLQLKAVDAGQPFRLLQRAGMATARMDDIIRQRSLDLKAAVTHMVEGDPELAVESLGGDVRTVPPERLAATAARLWLALTPEARAGTIILAPTHALREEIHGIVRRGLAEEGVLHGRVLEISRLVDRRLTRMHAADAQCYRPGDVAVANRDVYGCREGEAWTVTGAEGDRVLLERREERVALRPSGNAAHNLALCEARPLRIQAGDAIVWTRNIRRRGLINGERATVEAIARGKVRVRMTDGRKVSFATDDDDLRHIDHAWSSTVHRAQGLTTDNAIAVLDAASMMSDRSMLYVEMSRARHGFVLLTDDTEQLVARLEQEGQSVPSALEATGEAPWLRPDLALPVAQKPSLWPVLEDWRRHVAEAGARGEEPFRMDGCEALMARAGAHVRNGCDLPGELASAVEDHAAFARDRGLVNDWVTALLDVAGERKDLETHAASLETDIHRLTGRLSGWHGKLHKVFVDGREIAGDMVRYGPHLDLPGVDGGRLNETMEGVKRAAAFDTRAVALREELAKRTKHGTVRPSDDLARRIADLAGEAVPGTMPSELTEALARHRAGIDADAGALACVAAMERALQARAGLMNEKVPGDPLTGLEDYGRWKKVARSGVAEARTLLDGDNLDDGVRRRLSESAGLLETALRIDGRAETLDGDWKTHVEQAGSQGIHAFYAPGYDGLMERSRDLEREAGHPDEVPPRAVMALREHHGLVKTRDLIASWRATLERLAAEPDAPGDRWRRKAARALAAADWIIGREDICAVHMPAASGLRDTFEAVGETVERRLGKANRETALLLDWREHCAKAERLDRHPVDVPGYDDLVRRMTGLAADAAPGTMPPEFAAALAQYRAWTRARDCLAAMAGMLQARTRLLKEKMPGGPVTGHEDYRDWKTEVESCLAVVRVLPDGDDLDGVLRRRLSEPAGLLEKALRIDDRAEALDGDWKTHIERAGSQGIHAFHAPGHDGLMERSRDLEREADHPDEVPPRAVRALREHRSLVKTRDRIAFWRATLRRLAAEKAAPGDRWRRQATRAVAAADWITGREDICAVHMPSGSGLRDTFEAVTATVRERLGQANRAVDLLRDWRRFKAEAQSRDTEPYWMEGCDELMARVRSYWDDHSDLPPDLQYALLVHSHFVEQRKTVDYWPKALLDTAARRASLESDAASQGCDIRQFPDRLSFWTGNARREGKYVRKILDDQASYGLHLDAAGIDRGRLAGTLDGIRRALDFDERAAGILTALEGEAEHGKIRLSDDLIRRITDLASVAAPGTMPLALTDALARHQAGVEANARAHACLSAMEKALKARAGLLKAMGIDGPVTRLEDYRRWKREAESCHAEARALLDGNNLDDAVRRRLQEPAGLLEKTLRIDGKAEALDRAWETHTKRAMSHGVHAFYLPGHDALVKRARDFQREADSPAELPSRAAMALKELPGLVRNRNRIAFWRAALERLAAEDDMAGERWRRQATRALAAAEWISRRGDICAVHMPSTTDLRDIFEAVAVTVGNRLRQVNLEADLLRDWRAYCEQARRLGLQDFHAPGCDAIVEKIRDLDASAGGPLSPDLSRILEDHETFARDRDEARTRLDRVEACLQKRDKLLEYLKYEYWDKRPTKSLRTLTWRHRPWRRQAKHALAAARELLDEDKPWCKHLDGFEEGREGVERAAARLERASVLDRFEPSFVREWEENVEEARNKGLHLCLVPGHDRLVRRLENNRSAREDIAEFRETEVATFNRIMKTGKELEEASDELWRLNIPQRVLDTSMEEWLRNAGVKVENAESILKQEDDCAAYFAAHPDLKASFTENLRKVQGKLETGPEGWQERKKDLEETIQRGVKKNALSRKHSHGRSIS